MAGNNISSTTVLPDPVVNCSNLRSFPESNVRFANTPLAEIAVISVAVVFTLFIVLLYIECVVFIMRRYLLQKTRVLSIWLLGLQPVYAVTSIIAIAIPRAALLCDLVASIYLSLCLRTFFLLMLHYHGGEEAMIARMEGETINLRSPPVCCCCCCCPQVPVNKKTLSRIRVCVLQVAFLRPFVVFVATVLWSDGKYQSGDISPTSAVLYITIITVVSTILALYGLLLLFRASIKHLSKFNIVPKFFCVQLVLVISNLQGVVFNIMGNYNLPPCQGLLSSEARGNGLHHLLLVFEMFLLALVSRFFYRRVDSAQHVTELGIAYITSGDSSSRNNSLQTSEEKISASLNDNGEKAHDNIPV